MIILGGSASTSLAEKIAKELGEKPAEIEIKRFPDGEKYVRIHEDVKGKDVAIVQSLYRSPDEYIFEYLIIADTVRDMGASSITGVIPYLAYARQDSRFYPGEALTSASVAKLFEAAGTTSVLTVDCHLHRLGDVSRVFKVPAKNLFVVCTHPGLAKGAIKLVKAAGVSKIIATDTIPSPISKVSVAPVLAAALKNSS